MGGKQKTLQGSDESSSTKHERMTLTKTVGLGEKRGKNGEK